MNQTSLQSCLAEKLQLIKAICANNESQQRLLNRRNLRAVRRLLRERAVLIAELAAVDSQLTAADRGWQQQPAWQPIAQTINQLQRDMLNSCHQVLQQANTERLFIATELKSIKTARQLKNSYAPVWKGLNPGRLLSVRG